MSDKIIENIRIMAKRLTVAEQEIKKAIYMCENERIRLDILKNDRKGDDNEDSEDSEQKQNVCVVRSRNGSNEHSEWVESDNKLFGWVGKRNETNGSNRSLPKMSCEEKIHSGSTKKEGFKTNVNKDLPPLISIKRIDNQLSLIELNAKQALEQIDHERDIITKFAIEWCMYQGYRVVKNKVGQ